MKKIVLISCVSQKRITPQPAGELYVSQLFKKSLAYAHLLSPDMIFILSAEYGLLPLDRVVAPYSKTLSKMKIQERRLWAQGVLNSLKELCDLQQDEFIILAGMCYREFIFSELTNYQIPMERMTIGEQLRFLTSKG